MTDLETKLRELHDEQYPRCVWMTGMGTLCSHTEFAREAAAIGAAQRQAEIVAWLRSPDAIRRTGWIRAEDLGDAIEAGMGDELADEIAAGAGKAP